MVEQMKKNQVRRSSFESGHSADNTASLTHINKEYRYRKPINNILPSQCVPLKPLTHKQRTLSLTIVHDPPFLQSVLSQT